MESKGSSASVKDSFEQPTLEDMENAIALFTADQKAAFQRFKEGISQNHRSQSATRLNAIPFHSKTPFETISALGNAPIFLPSEVILGIASYAEPVTRASLSLSCRTFYYLLKLDYKELSLTKKEHQGFRECREFIPKFYRPLRWGFLELLEKDLSPKVVLCTLCFVLHPVQDHEKLYKPTRSLITQMRRRHQIRRDNPCRNRPIAESCVCGIEEALTGHRARRMYTSTLPIELPIRQKRD